MKSVLGMVELLLCHHVEDGHRLFISREGACLGVIEEEVGDVFIDAVRGS